LERIRANKPAKPFDFKALTLEYHGSNSLTGFFTQSVELKGRAFTSARTMAFCEVISSKQRGSPFLGNQWLAPWTRQTYDGR
jgi:hypothetical protein